MVLKNQKTDLDDQILKLFISADQRDSNKGFISRIYKGVTVQKPQTTEMRERGSFIDIR